MVALCGNGMSKNRTNNTTNPPNWRIFPRKWSQTLDPVIFSQTNVGEGEVLDQKMFASDSYKVFPIIYSYIYYTQVCYIQSVCKSVFSILLSDGPRFYFFLFFPSIYCILINHCNSCQSNNFCSSIMRVLCTIGINFYFFIVRTSE